jgi:hypothetical protein
MNYLDVLSIVQEDDAEKLIPNEEALRVRIEPYGEFQGGRILDVVVSEASTIAYMFGESPPVGNREVIPFPGRNLWSQEYYYYLFDLTFYTHDAVTPHGPFYAEGYRYLRDPRDFIHVVTLAYDTGIDKNLIKEHLSDEGKECLRMNEIELSRKHQELLQFLTE